MSDQQPIIDHNQTRLQQDQPEGNSEQVQPARYAPPLSQMEQRVCVLLLQSLTEHAVAEHLSRSPNTIHVHVRNIYRKLGVCSRKQLLEYPEIASIAGGNQPSAGSDVGS